MRAVIRITVKKHIGYTETIPFSIPRDYVIFRNSSTHFPYKWHSLSYSLTNTVANGGNHAKIHISFKQTPRK